MKKILLLFFLTFISICEAQDWLTSIEAAKRLALIQNKMLFVMWEESTDYPYPITVNADNGVKIYTNLFEDDQVNRLIWENFVPVKLPESKYSEFSDEVKETRGQAYFNKLVSDDILIMDPNGYILNMKATPELREDLSMFIKRYSLNISYMKQELINYAKKVNFSTSFRLATKYMDYTILSNKNIRPEVTALGSIYFENARMLLRQEDIENKEGYKQRCDLMEMKKYLILNNPRKVLRLLKKMDPKEVNAINQSLFAFLHYTAYKILENENQAALWKTKVSLVDLKKANLIIRINT